MILPRDQLVSLLERSHVQVAASPGAEWITTRTPALARNTIDETIIANGSGYWSPRGFYLTLMADLDDAEGNVVVPSGTLVFADPASTVSLVGKSENGTVRPVPSMSTRSDAMVGASLVVGSAVFVAAGLG